MLAILMPFNLKEWLSLTEKDRFEALLSGSIPNQVISKKKKKKKKILTPWSKQGAHRSLRGHPGVQKHYRAT